jgi:hypothetical protein
MSMMSIIAVSAMVLLVLGFGVAQGISDYKSKRGFSIDNIIRTIIGGVDKFIKGLVTNSIGLIILAFDFGFVFATAALTKDLYVSQGEYAYMIAFLVASVPFVFATYFANITSNILSLKRWFNKYVKVEEIKDYQRSRKPGVGDYIWTLAFSDKTSVPYMHAQEYQEDKTFKYNVYILIGIGVFWAGIQYFILGQINSSVELLAEQAGVVPNYYNARIVMVCTIALDLAFTISTLNVMSGVQDFEDEFQRVLSKSPSFTDITTWASENKIDVGAELPVINPPIVSSTPPPTGTPPIATPPSPSITPPVVTPPVVATPPAPVRKTRPRPRKNRK